MKWSNIQGGLLIECCCISVQSQLVYYQIHQSFSSTDMWR